MSTRVPTDLLLTSLAFLIGGVLCLAALYRRGK